MSYIVLSAFALLLFETVSYVAHRFALWAIGVCPTTWKYRHVIAHRTRQGESAASICKYYKITETSFQNLIRRAGYLDLRSPNDDN